jgi:hypothetical protein
VASYEAFKKDDFSADKAMSAGDIDAPTRAGANQMIAMYKELAAILTPEQRAKLAKEMVGG